MRTTIAGPDFSANADQVINVDAKTAQPLLDGGYAVAVKETPETAEKPKAEETAEAPKPDSRKGKLSKPHNRKGKIG